MTRRRKVLVALAGALVLLAGWARLGPLPAAVRAPAAARDYLLTDRAGEPLLASVSIPEQPGGPPLARRAGKLAAATLAAEDRRFHRHPGVDPLAMARAAWVDLRARRFIQGGSTLTQQLVKLRLGRPPRTLPQKLREMVWALRLERSLGKEAILSAYLAEAPYGGRVTGAEAAARLYFGKPASQLTWAEAALLAALPQRPTAFNPRKSPDAARDRQRWILARLAAEGKLAPAELRAALDEAPAFDEPGGRGALAPHFSEMLVGRLRGAGVPPGRIATTLDGPLQRAVEGIARHHRGLLARHGAANVAVVVLDNRDGAVRAWEGSGGWLDFTRGGMINGPLVARQTGSTIKPFIFALAFEGGALPGELIDDAPLEIRWNGERFAPQNYDRRFRGPIPLREALGSSINVPAVRLLQRVGPGAFARWLERANLRPPRPAQGYGLSLALGAAELSLVDMTRAYALFPRGGVPLAVRHSDADPPAPATAPLVGREAAFLVTDVLADNAARAPVFGEESALAFPFSAAAKTGTSSDFHDNWAIGYTRDFTVGVWVGNFDRAPLRGASGVTGAGPIFHSVMLAARERLSPGLSADAPILEPPPGLARVPQCADAACRNPRWDWRRAAHAEGQAADPAPVRAGVPALALSEPNPGAAYYIDPTRPRAVQRIPLAAHGGRAPYRFTVDGRPVAPERSPGREPGAPLWPLAPGRHRACVRDAAGAEACLNFRVDAAE